MNEQEMLDTIEVTLDVTQTGKSDADACQKIFDQLRKDIHGHVEGYLIEMHVISFVFLEKRVENETKKFLFFFLPVVYEHYVYTARIKALVTILKPN